MQKSKVKFGDLIKALNGNNTLFRPQTIWDIGDDGKLLLETEVEVTEDTDVEIEYYWYHHMMPQEHVDEIRKTIISGDFWAFNKWYRTLWDRDYTYLPQMAFVSAGDVCIGELAVALTAETFDLITCEECECG